MFTNIFHVFFQIFFLIVDPMHSFERRSQVPRRDMYSVSTGLMYTSCAILHLNVPSHSPQVIKGPIEASL